MERKEVWSKYRASVIYAIYFLDDSSDYMLESISLDYSCGEERDQKLSQEITMKLESKPNNKEEVDQDAFSEVEIKNNSY